MDTRSVIEHHLAALQAADLAATLEDYAEDAVLVTQGQELRGHEALSAVCAPALEALFAPGHAFTLDHLVVTGDYAMIEWHMSFPGGSVTFGTDTFVLSDGKIVYQTGAAVLGE